MAGNETSDFSGSSPACKLDRAALPTDPDALAGIERLREAYAGTLTLPMRWKPGATVVGPESPFFAAVPAGYEPATRVNVDVVLGDTEYFVGSPANGTDPTDCPDGFRVPAALSIATDDGAFEVDAQGSFTTVPGLVNDLRAFANLADAVGSLDLNLHPDRVYRGGVFVEIVALDEGKRGSLQLSVSMEEPYLATDYPLDATFPDDGCDWTHGFPIDADAPLPAWSGASAAQILSDWRASLAPLRVPAVWADCSAADVRFELGEPSLVCAGSRIGQPGGALRFDADNRVITSDGRLDTIVTRALIAADGLSLNSVEPLAQLPPDEFATTAGVRGVDPGSSPWLTSAVTASVQRNGGDLTAIGFLRVQGLECTDTDCNTYRYRETLDWPHDSSFAPSCE